MTIAEKLQQMTPQEQRAFLLKNVRESHTVVKSLLADQSVHLLPRIVSVLEGIIKYLEMSAESKP